MISAKVNISRKVYNEAYRSYLDELADVQIYYGGSSSGKSVFISQRHLRDVMRGNRNFLVCRQVARTLQKSVVQELKQVIDAWGVQSLFSVNKTDGTITCENGYQIIFAGLDDVEKLKSIRPQKGVITDIWVEEATETDRSSLKQLEKRLRGGDESTKKRILLSFNPVLISSWIYQEFFKNIAWADDQKEYRSDNLTILKTTYKDNAHLTLQDIERLENETDPYYHDVYTLGNWGVLGNVIFRNWRVEDLSEIRNQFVNRRNGIDFGFSSDPAAAPLTHYDKSHKTIYIFDELYETGLTNDILADRLKTMDGNAYWKADSAEPKSIAELQAYGIYVGPAAKGKDSVVHGIQWLQQQTIIVDAKCINMRNELSGYKWKEDAGGNALPIPVDKNNHLIDALRYAYEDEMDGGGWLVM